MQLAEKWLSTPRPGRRHCLIAPADAFSPSYARARVQFLEAAATAGMAIQQPQPSFARPRRRGTRHGRGARWRSGGRAPAHRQQRLPRRGGLLRFWRAGVRRSGRRVAPARTRKAGVPVLYIHALNPHGFSWMRRVTHENVDLNRNFQDFSQPLPVNEAYAELYELLLPDAMATRRGTTLRCHRRLHPDPRPQPLSGRGVTRPARFCRRPVLRRC